MPRPALFVIDDDAGVVRALRDDLGRRFGEDFRVIGESSAAAGLAALRELADCTSRVALLIVDHDMSEMPGADFLARAHDMHPLAKRVLLVERDYSARSPVVQAMTLGQADYHITKPWMLEQDLYREVSEFLAEWAKDQQAGFDLFHVIGRDRPRHARAARAAHPVQRAVPLLPPPTAQQGRQPARRTRAWTASRLPVMIRHDGYTMVEPTPAQIIAAVGGSTRNDVSECDVAIVGAGPGGPDRRRLRRVRGPADGRAGGDRLRRPGGKQPDDPELPGLPARHQRARAHPPGLRAGLDVRRAHGVLPARRRPGVPGRDRVVHLADGHQITARAVIVATGIAWRRLGVPRLEALVGSGVFYGAAGQRDCGHGGPRRVRRGGGELGRPDRAAPGAARPAGDACWCAGTTWRGRCRTT